MEAAPGAARPRPAAGGRAASRQDEADEVERRVPDADPEDDADAGQRRLTSSVRKEGRPCCQGAALRVVSGSLYDRALRTRIRHSSELLIPRGDLSGYVHAWSRSAQTSDTFRPARR